MHHRGMKRCLLMTLLVACEKPGPTGTTVDLTTPAAAARCQLDAIRARSVAKWGPCWHPLALEEGVMGELDDKLRKDPGRWERMARESARLDGAKDADFKLGPVPLKQAKLGDQMAELQLERDQFIVVRKDGRWYIVDSGV